MKKVGLVVFTSLGSVVGFCADEGNVQLSQTSNRSFVQLKQFSPLDRKVIVSSFKNNYGVDFNLSSDEYMRIAQHDNGKKIDLSTVDNYRIRVNLDKSRTTKNEEARVRPDGKKPNSKPDKSKSGKESEDKSKKDRRE